LEPVRGTQVGCFGGGGGGWDDQKLPEGGQKGEKVGKEVSASFGAQPRVQNVGDSARKRKKGSENRRGVKNVPT